MHTVGKATSKAIYDDAHVAYGDQEHPCHQFVQLQEGVPPERWQLPEPFNGWSAQAGLVFLALNPSFDPGENVPRYGASFEEWDHYYRGRFDVSSWGRGTLYGRYQQLGEIAWGGTFQLGHHALVLEAVRYKSARGRGCKDPKVLGHEIEVTRRLLADIRPRVILGQGGALRELGRLLPELERELKQESIRKLEGRLLRMPAPFGGELIVVPSRHLTGAWGMTNDDRRRVGESLARALAS